MERRCAKLSWSCLNSDSYVAKTIAKSAKCSSVSNFEDNYTYFSYKYKIGSHVWIHCYVNYINVSIHIFFIVLQFLQKVLLYVICV